MDVHSDQLWTAAQFKRPWHCCGPHIAELRFRDHHGIPGGKLKCSYRKASTLLRPTHTEPCFRGHHGLLAGNVRTRRHPHCGGPHTEPRFRDHYGPLNENVRTGKHPHCCVPHGEPRLRDYHGLNENARTRIHRLWISQVGLQPLTLRSESMSTVSSRKPYEGHRRKLVIAFDIGTTFSGVSYVILIPGEPPSIQGVTQ